jgi:hypothetical protein
VGERLTPFGGRGGPVRRFIEVGANPPGRYLKLHAPPAHPHLRVSQLPPDTRPTPPTRRRPSGPAATATQAQPTAEP